MQSLLLLTPPLVQTNTPYPATMHLTGFLRGRGFEVHQRDLGIKVVLDVLREYGGEEADELLELLQGSAPPEAKVEASALIDDLAIWIRDNVDASFGFSRYAERISAQAADFGEIERLVRKKGVMDKPLERHLAAAIAETEPTVIGVTCPFPGTLVAAFKIAKYVRRHHPDIRLVLGGGFVSTELREMTDKRPYTYFDDFLFDEGYEPMLRLLSPVPNPPSSVTIPPFVAPCYDGIDWSEYFDVVETENPMHRLWSVGRWRKLQMARGCYWHKCAFCDVILPYIGCFEQPTATEIVDAMEDGRGYHFVDEAMPPGLIRKVSEEILRRKLKVEWWGNVRFDTSFTPELCRLMAKAGCIAVTGGLECADDRLLALMTKGITLDSATKALKAFHAAGIMVHAYLMYGFPTETEAEAFGALEFVRGLFKKDLLQSAFWHRFALTVHSPIYRTPEKFGIEIVGETSRLPTKKNSKNPKVPRPRFCKNEVAFLEPDAPDWETIGKALDLALYNYLEGRGLDKKATDWKRLAKRSRR